MNVSSHIVSASASLLRQEESRNFQAKLSTQLWQWYVAVTIAQLCPCDLNIIERPSFRSWNHDISFQRYIFLFNVSQNSDMDVLGCSRVVLRGQMHVVISFTTHIENCSLDLGLTSFRMWMMPSSRYGGCAQWCWEFAKHSRRFDFGSMSQVWR